jgi:hypothetical protein
MSVALLLPFKFTAHEYNEATTLRAWPKGSFGYDAHTLLLNRQRGDVNHSLKNRTGGRTGEAVGLGFYRSDHWFTGSVFGFLNY